MWLGNVHGVFVQGRVCDMPTKPPLHDGGVTGGTAGVACAVACSAASTALYSAARERSLSGLRMM